MVSSEISLVEVVSSDVSDKNKYILLVNITNNSSKYLLKYPKAIFLSVPPDHFLLRNLPPSGRFEKPLEAARLGGAPILSPADPCTYTCFAAPARPVVVSFHLSVISLEFFYFFSTLHRRPTLKAKVFQFVRNGFEHFNISRGSF